jgi:hypothetical protein
MVRLAIFLLSKPWGWLGIGAVVLGIGGLVFAQAHVTQPVEIDGTFAHYREYTNNGSYDHNEIILNEDSSHSYTLNKNDFHPALPSEVYKDGKVSIWVDQGTTNVVAIRLYDQQDQNPTMYTTDVYDHPDHSLQNGHLGGEITAGVGGLLMLVGVAWFFIPGRRKQPAPVAAGRAPSAYDRLGAPGAQPTSYTPQGGAPGTYGQQPGYAPPNQPTPGGSWGQPPAPYGQPDAGSGQGGQGNWGGPPPQR